MDKVQGVEGTQFIHVQGDYGLEANSFEHDLGTEIGRLYYLILSYPILSYRDFSGSLTSSMTVSLESPGMLRELLELEPSETINNRNKNVYIYNEHSIL